MLNKIGSKYLLSSNKRPDNKNKKIAKTHQIITHIMVNRKLKTGYQ
jgi:hypothetical protein